MTALANQLTIQEAIVGSGVQIFKLAAMANFIQGRRMDMVAACCLYSACRKEKPCRVMLIDFADKVQVCSHSSPFNLFPLRLPQPSPLTVIYS
jgi:transcription factor IIIB subunit 2